MIRFIYINFRYLLFEEGGDVYLIDRKPRNPLAYLLFPLHWYTKKKVYKLTESEAKELQEHNLKTSKGIVYSTAFVGGVIVLFSQLLSSIDIVEQTAITMSNLLKFSSILVGGMLMISLTCYIFFLHQRALNKVVRIEKKEVSYFQFWPKRPKGIILKFVLGQLLMYALLIGVIVAYVSSNSLFFLYGVCLLIFVLLISSANAYNNEVFYKIKEKNNY